MKCPKDGTAMKRFPIYNINIDVCPECHGVWFDGDELMRVTREFGIGNFHDFFEAWKQKEHAVRETDNFWKEDTRECPRDYVHMHKHFYAGDSGIGVDHCTVCEGFWVDGGELQEIWEYNKPDTSRDGMAQGLVGMLKESEQFKKDIEELPARLVMLASHPYIYAAFAFSKLIEVLNERIAFPVRRL
jgi:Zn-finger nucleic acid-binding protein